jgi:tRNA(fMet)-specific endonuclease VapC
MTVLPFTEAVARRAARLHAELIQRNEDIGVKDVLIAASCLEHSLPILTLNERHVSRVPGLEVITPEALLSRPI